MALMHGPWLDIQVGGDLLEVITAVTTLATATGTLVLAFGTKTLADGTTDLARSTDVMAQATLHEVELAKEQVTAVREHAEAAQKQSTLAEAALNASIRPLLVEVPPGMVKEVKAWNWFAFGVLGTQEKQRDTEKIDISRVRFKIDEDGEEQTSEIDMTVPIRNVGVGPAMLRGVRLEVPLEDGGVHIVVGRAEHSTLPVAEATNLLFEVPYGTADWEPLRSAAERRANLTAEAIYTDLGGKQESRTLIHLKGTGEEAVTYKVLTSETVFVESNPAGTPWG